MASAHFPTANVELHSMDELLILQTSSPRCLYSGSPASPKWNPMADVNQDGKVGLKDIALVANHFRQHYPQSNLFCRGKRARIREEIKTDEDYLVEVAEIGFAWFGLSIVQMISTRLQLETQELCPPMGFQRQRSLSLMRYSTRKRLLRGLGSRRSFEISG